MITTAAFLAELETAHARAVAAARAGLGDAALGNHRLSGPGVLTLAEAAVSSATPYLRAPLLSRVAKAARLHDRDGLNVLCRTCSVPSPCPTLLALRE
jgi:hypothetical protein